MTKSKINETKERIQKDLERIKEYHKKRTYYG